MKMFAFLLASSIASAQDRPYDCLAGVCLNDVAVSVQDITVSMAGRTWQRSIEVCQNRVASIALNTGWYQPGIKLDGVLPGVYTLTQGDAGPEAMALRSKVDATIRAQEWREVTVQGPATVYWFAVSALGGTRILALERLEATAPHVWTVTLGSAHPNRTELCKTGGL
jgi:hypothetical protein